MRVVFADTFFWTALADPQDHWHDAVRDFDPALGDAKFVTTDEVLVEFATQLGVRDQRLREIAVRWVNAILEDPGVEVIPQSRASFLMGLDLYEARPDKLYSLTDCISMQTMKKREIAEALTHDHHFSQ